MVVSPYGLGRTSFLATEPCDPIEAETVSQRARVCVYVGGLNLITDITQFLSTTGNTLTNNWGGADTEVVQGLSMFLSNPGLIPDTLCSSIYYWVKPW